MCESGTLNVVGLTGLEVGMCWVLERGVEAIRAHEEALTQHLVAGLRNIPDVTVYGGLDATCQTATVSFNIAGMSLRRQDYVWTRKSRSARSPRLGGASR